MRRLLKETKLDPVASPGPALLSTLLLAADHMHAQAEKLAVSDEKIDIYAEEVGCAQGVGSVSGGCTIG
jgi:formylmethanofuran dehydrogenase subunit E